MIKLNETYSLDADRYQWILHEGNKRTYHATIPQVARHIADHEARKTVQDMDELVDSVGKLLAKKLEGLMKDKIKG